MKTTKLLISGLCALVLAFACIACEDPAGPVGVDGEAGITGDDGITGADGSNGIDSVIAITASAKTGYSQYESFTSAGLVVRAYYTDGSVATVNSGYRMYWNDTLLIDGNYAITQEMGNKTITVQWQNRVTSFDIKVLEPSSILRVWDESTWKQALSTISAGGSGTSAASKGYVIEVIEGAEVGVEGSTINNSFGSVNYVSVTLKGEGRLYLTSQGSLICLTSNQTLIIDSEDLTMGGMSSNNAAVVYVWSNSSSATLELRSGTISGNSNNSYGSSGGGVHVLSGTFTMSGGNISGNSAYSSGGGVYIGSSGTFTMSGGNISGNSAPSAGGGVYVLNGTFTMSGGNISGNNASTSGGGVDIGSSGTFTMSGGGISGNTASYGGGVYVSTNSSFNKLGGGIIYGNNADAGDKNTATWNGHAVYYGFGSAPYPYRNTTLGKDDNLSTNDVSELSGWNK